MEDVKLYAPICKIDKEKRLVYGFATTEAAADFCHYAGQ